MSKIKIINPEDCGIYKISCLSRRGFEYIYIGSSFEILERWSKHRLSVVGRYHPNAKIQAVGNKYGIDKFQFEIVELCSIDEFEEKEEYYIKKFDTFNTRHGLNLTNKVVRWMDGLSEESKKRHSENIPSKTINLIDPTGNLIIVKNIAKFCRENNLIKKSIYCLCHGTMRQHRGYRLPPEDTEIFRFECRVGHRKMWTLVSPKGEIIRTNHLSAFCAENGLDRGSIKDLKRRKGRRHRSYMYFFEPTIDQPWDSEDFAEYPGFDGDKRIFFPYGFKEERECNTKNRGKIRYFKNPDGVVFKTDNVTALARELGLHSVSLNRVSGDSRRQYKGYIKSSEEEYLDFIKNNKNE